MEILQEHSDDLIALDNLEQEHNQDITEIMKILHEHSDDLIALDNLEQENNRDIVSPKISWLKSYI